MPIKVGMVAIHLSRIGCMRACVWVTFQLQVYMCYISTPKSRIYPNAIWYIHQFRLHLLTWEMWPGRYSNQNLEGWTAIAWVLRGPIDKSVVGIGWIIKKDQRVKMDGSDVQMTKVVMCKQVNPFMITFYKLGYGITQTPLESCLVFTNSTV